MSRLVVADTGPLIHLSHADARYEHRAYEHSRYEHRACEHRACEPDEITQLYPDPSLGDVHRALAHYDDHIDEISSADAADG